MESIEQELMNMLRRLPTPIIITWRGGQYYWQCGQGTGSSSHLITTVEGALRFVMSDLAVHTSAVKEKD